MMMMMMIHGIERNKSPFKISGKIAVGVLRGQGLPKISLGGLIMRPNRARTGDALLEMLMHLSLALYWQLNDRPTCYF